MIKRFLDFLFALTGLTVLLPVGVVVAGFIKLTDSGPIFFWHERVGRFGHKFKMLKFRTMRVAKPGESGPQLTVGGDPRVTRIGHFLRKTKLDEMPQLWNVLIGQMSFVGPRPEVPRYVDLYTPEERSVLMLRPGITDLASFAFFAESDLLAKQSDPEKFYTSVLVSEKIRINLAYARTANPLTDLVLIVATVLRSLGVQIDMFGWLKVSPPAILEAK